MLKPIVNPKIQNPKVIDCVVVVAAAAGILTTKVGKTHNESSVLSLIYNGGPYRLLSRCLSPSYNNTSTYDEQKND